MIDRDDVHEVYAEWREVFDSYDPPRTAVAEAWVEPSRIPLYARAESLGQAFNFDLLEADFDAAQFRRIVGDNLALAAKSGSSTTWVLSNHDVVRHATRYGLPDAERDEKGRPTRKHGNEWLLSGGKTPVLDRERGLRRARAASLFVLGLPGSAYVYQGEELGLHEVASIPESERQDPTFFRSPGEDIGRDGCRVPLPWSVEGSSFGFGSGGAHLPQPDWFAEYAVSAQDGDPTSTLALYRQALAMRRLLQTEESLQWIETGRDDVLAFRRPNGWTVVTNFGQTPHALPADGARSLSSRHFEGDELPPETTVWLTGA
jgi:alpha-glucosidase